MSTGPQATAQAPQITEAYVAFAGQIDQNSVQRFFSGFGGAMAKNIKSIHLMFQSTGGFIGDGICLYNYLQKLPIEVILYNSGTIASIATIVYLGGQKRKTSAQAIFMIHRSYNFPQAATQTHLKTVLKGLTLDDKRTEAILRRHINLTEDQWKQLDSNDLVFSAEEAVRIGLADEIADFTPPKGSQVFTI